MNTYDFHIVFSILISMHIHSLEHSFGNDVMFSSFIVTHIGNYVFPIPYSMYVNWVLVNRVSEDFTVFVIVFSQCLCNIDTMIEIIKIFYYVNYIPFKKVGDIF